MKTPIIVLFLFFIFSCNTKKNSVSIANKLNCPKDGKCTIEIIKNKSLLIKKDDLGFIYYHLMDNNQSSVIAYKYERNVEKGLQDGHYNEEIIFEIENKNTSLNLTDTKLEKTKMLFGRHCFCKGQAGYFQVNKGTLILEKKNETIELNLDISVNEVPQIITSIITVIK